MKTKPETIARTIILALALINATLNIFGIAPIEIQEDVIYQAVTAIAMIAAAVWAWWKNNSFSPEAKHADEILRIIREKGIPALEEIYAIFAINDDDDESVEEDDE